MFVLFLSRHSFSNCLVKIIVGKIRLLVVLLEPEFTDHADSAGISTAESFSRGIVIRFIFRLYYLIVKFLSAISFAKITAGLNLKTK